MDTFVVWLDDKETKQLNEKGTVNLGTAYCFKKPVQVVVKIYSPERAKEMLADVATDGAASSCENKMEEKK
jgi:hypothetical protein